MTEPTPPKRRRRWFSISLRGLMILVLVLGGLMGWKVRRASLQRRAVTAIGRLNGSISYDWEPKGREPAGPSWLRRMLGDEYFQEVVSVTLPDGSGNAIRPQPPETPPESPEWHEFRVELQQYQEFEALLAEDNFVSLEGLEGIETLHYYGPALSIDGEVRLGRLSRLMAFSTSSPLSGKGLALVGKLSHLERLDLQLKLSDTSELSSLERLTRLKFLSINDPDRWAISWGTADRENSSRVPSEITDAWLFQLRRLRQLTQLFLHGYEITDVGLAHLNELDHLESLSVDSPRIGDPGLGHLERLQGLTFLELKSAIGVTDAGLAHLAGNHKLEHLDLSSATKITDSGLAHLIELQKLGDLYLESASEITDAGLVHLARLTKLSILKLNAKSLTDGGLIRLGSLPGLEAVQLCGREIKKETLDQMKAINPNLNVVLESTGGAVEGGVVMPSSEADLSPRLPPSPPAAPRN